MNLKKLLDSGKSFIYIKNSSGPKMESCGTPVTIGNVLDAVSFNSTNCSLFRDLAPIPPESLHLSLHGPSPHLFWSPPPPVSGRGPAHGYSWNRYQWHSVNMANPPPSSFLYFQRDGQHPSSLVKRYRLAKICAECFYLRHLFWNTSSMWNIPLVTFQDSVAYSSTLTTLLLEIRIFVFLLIVFVFQMFFSASNAPLALLILVLISASVFPSFVTLAPRYVNYATSSMSCSPSLIGSAV